MRMSDVTELQKPAPKRALALEIPNILKTRKCNIRTFTKPCPECTVAPEIFNKIQDQNQNILVFLREDEDFIRFSEIFLNYRFL